MRPIDADALIEKEERSELNRYIDGERCYQMVVPSWAIIEAPTIDAVSVVRCKDCKKSHIDGKTTHYLWCVEWGRSTDVFGYCERGEREGE